MLTAERNASNLQSSIQGLKPFKKIGRISAIIDSLESERDTWDLSQKESYAILKEFLLYHPN